MLYHHKNVELAMNTQPAADFKTILDYIPDHGKKIIYLTSPSYTRNYFVHNGLSKYGTLEDSFATIIMCIYESKTIN